MTGATVILIILCVFAAIVGGTIAFFFGRIAWAMRNPEKFKAFQEREIAAESARRQKYHEAERERIRLGKPSWAGRFFGALFVFAAILSTIWAVWAIYDIARAQFWQETTCTILSRSYSVRSSKNSTTYVPSVKYSYRAGDRDLTGEKFNFIGTFDSWRETQEFLKDYPPGQQVACYFNSQDPGESVIERSIFQFAAFKTLAGLTLCYGLGFFLFYVSRPGKPKDSLK